MISQDTLKALLHYDPETGVFTWLYRRAGKGRNGVRDGDIAGWLDAHPSKGYRFIEIEHRVYKAANLAWLYMTGEWPAQPVDHKDRDRTNDRWANLRLCSKSQNGANMSLRRDNTSGVRGVNWNKRQQKWHARLMKNGESLHLGFFETLEDAIQARQRKAKELYGEFDFAAIHPR